MAIGRYLIHLCVFIRLYRIYANSCSEQDEDGDWPIFDTFVRIHVLYVYFRIYFLCRLYRLLANPCSEQDEAGDRPMFVTFVRAHVLYVLLRNDLSCRLF